MSDFIKASKELIDTINNYPQPWETVYIPYDADIKVPTAEETKTIPIIYSKPQTFTAPQKAKFNIGDIVMVGGKKAKVCKVIQHHNPWDYSQFPDYVVEFFKAGATQTVFPQQSLSLAVASTALPVAIEASNNGHGPRCECGSSAVGIDKHSGYCPLYTRE